MKIITFLRHSKSSWDYNVSDIDRPLNEFGINKIIQTAKSSANHFSLSEIIFTSPAIRALHTSIILSRELSIDSKKVKVCEDLYTFNYNDVLKFIKNINENFSNVVLVGHNPAYTEINNYFSNNNILNLPTARWFSLTFESENWINVFSKNPILYQNNLKK